MKILIKLFIVCLIFTSCEETETAIFDGRTGVGFEQSDVNLTVPEGGITQTVGLVSTTTSSTARTFDIAVVSEGTDEDAMLEASDYSIGTATIPADSYLGTLDVTFNYDGLEDFTEYSLTVELVAPGSAFSPVTFSFLREFDITTFVCPDLNLEIVEDAFADERDWTIVDSTGAIVLQCSDFASCPGGAPSGSIAAATYNYPVDLPAGCYTFTIFDSFGDGLFDGNIEGTYSLFCAAQPLVEYATGSGDFGPEESTDFCIIE